MTETALDPEIQAKIEKLNAERDFHLANARVADVLHAQEIVNLGVRQRAEQEELSRDKFHKVYVFDEDVTEHSVKDCRRQLTTWDRADAECSIEIQLNSPGGDIFEGLALVDFLRDYRSRGHHVRIVVHGVAASMAGVILQAGDTRIMGKNAFMLIHRGSAGTSGDIARMEDDMKLLTKLQERLLDILESRSNMTKAQIKKAWDRTDWWLTADEALAKGFVDLVQ